MHARAHRGALLQTSRKLEGAGEAGPLHDRVQLRALHRPFFSGENLKMVKWGYRKCPKCSAECALACRKCPACSKRFGFGPAKKPIKKAPAAPTGAVPRVMPKKTCPTCETQHWPRVRVCSCSHVFFESSSTPRVPTGNPVGRPVGSLNRPIYQGPM